MEEAPQPRGASLSDVSGVVHVVLVVVWSLLRGARARETKKGPGGRDPRAFRIRSASIAGQQARTVQPQAREASFCGAGQQQVHAKSDMTEGRYRRPPPQARADFTLQELFSRRPARVEQDAAGAMIDVPVLTRRR